MRDLDRTVSELRSEIEELTESHKRLRSREGMRELRERRARPEPVEVLPAHEETKLDVRRRLFPGITSHIDFVKRQQQLELERKANGKPRTAAE